MAFPSLSQAHRPSSSASDEAAAQQRASADSVRSPWLYATLVLVERRSGSVIINAKPNTALPRTRSPRR
jgi:hypothetical protein